MLFEIDRQKTPNPTLKFRQFNTQKTSHIGPQNWRSGRRGRRKVARQINEFGRPESLNEEIDDHANEVAVNMPRIAIFAIDGHL